jgi:hypothetical protein
MQAQSDEDEDILRLLMGDAYRPVKRHSHYTCTTTAAEGTAMQDAPMQPAPTTDSQVSTRTPLTIKLGPCSCSRWIL